MSAHAADTQADAHVDAHVDQEIAACLDLDAPRSFFLFAGAGSGKTSSLVRALEHVRATMSDRLRTEGQRVAVITYTNAASEEIKRRLQFDPLIDVRTIHSFAWSLIEGLHRDIRTWLSVSLVEDIEELKALEAKGRKGSRASSERLRRIESKTRRLQNLPNVKVFTYSPTGDNRGRDALNHAEVLQISAAFLKTKPAMQNILVGRHPILLIDESQDTNKGLVEALFTVEAQLKGRFTLGLLGDMMQRIYADGKDDLDRDLPGHWAQPTKKLNYRCPRRVITLINKVRSVVDGQQQQPRQSAADGCVRMFILSSDLADKPAAEMAITQHMAEVTGDARWTEAAAVKALTLEHRMAASRMGFLDAFGPLYDYDAWRTSLLDGSLGIANFFAHQVLPLVKAKQAGDRFALARIAKSYSPLLSPEALRRTEDQKQQLEATNRAIDTLLALWKDGASPTLSSVLRCVFDTGLLEVPEALQSHASPLDRRAGDVFEDADADDRRAERDLAIEAFLKAPFSQIEPMTEYLAGRAHFGTHQGVKGLEFERVMVIIDDDEARGFSFSYENLFGGKPTGDKTVENTRRLFYVTASRAEKSLALVAYTAHRDRVRQFLLDEGWFAAEEIVISLQAKA